MNRCCRKKEITTTSKKIEEKPIWFDKEISENKESEEEIKEMQDLLKEFR